MLKHYTHYNTALVLFILLEYIKINVDIYIYILHNNILFFS